MNRYIVLVALGALLAACADVPQQQQQASDPPSDKRYVTGSRLPVRDGSGSSEINSVQDKREIQKMMQPGSTTAPPRAGG